MITKNLKHVISDYLSWSPLSLVIRETCRIFSFQSFLQQLSQSNLKALDVGCGDGCWWKYLRLSSNKNINVTGIDINAKEINIAKKNINAEVIDITKKSQTTFLDKDFDIIIGNCSLEHIPDINSALKNIHDHLQNDGHFLLYVPTPDWALKGRSIELLNKLSPRLAMSYSGFINGFFQHRHLYHYDIWSHLLSRNGFKVETIRGIGSKELEFLFRLHLPSSFISFIIKVFTGKYLNFWLNPFIPNFFQSYFSGKINSLVLNSLTSPDDEYAFEYMIICRKEH